MATLTIQDGELVVGLSRWEKAGALHGDVRVPLRSVEDVSVSARPFGDLRGMRAPGTGWPRVAFRYSGSKDFAALYRRKPAVIVRLRDAEFRRLLIAADDAEAVAARVRDAG